MVRSFWLLLLAVLAAGCTLHVTKRSEDILPQTIGQPDLPSYDLSIKQTALAARRAMESLDWSVNFLPTQGPSSVIGHVAPTFTSNGETVEVLLIGSSGEKTKVHVTSRSDFQAYDWGRNAENIKKFYAALNTIITSGNLGASPEKRFADVIVTAGPISQPYRILGEVHANTLGMINFGSALNDALFRSPLAVAAGGRTPSAHTEQMNKLLKTQARKSYSNNVDAIINTTYRTDHDGDVYASGLAVQFTEEKREETKTSLPPERHLEDRLKELQSLKEKKLISEDEYYQKRSEILKDF